MTKSLMAICLMSSALIAVPAMAQQTNSAAPATTATASSTDTNHQFITDQAAGTWRASKLVGLGVYNQQNENIGNINELLIDKSGKATGVVIAVGGFLGLGEHYVAVPYDSLQWSMTPVGGRTASTGGTSLADPTGAANPNTSALGNPTTGPTGAPPTSDTPRNAQANTNPNPAYPDHAILANASRDQLKNAPQFNFGSAPR